MADNFRVNWAEAFDFMHAAEDQATKNLLCAFEIHSRALNPLSLGDK